MDSEEAKPKRRTSKVCNVLFSIASIRLLQRGKRRSVTPTLSSDDEWAVANNLVGTYKYDIATKATATDCYDAHHLVRIVPAHRFTRRFVQQNGLTNPIVLTGPASKVQKRLGYQWVNDRCNNFVLSLQLTQITEEQFRGARCAALVRRRSCHRSSRLRYAGGDDDDVAAICRLLQVRVMRTHHYRHTLLFRSPKRDVIYNVLSLEFSNMKMRENCQPPRLVSELDWVQCAWPQEYLDVALQNEVNIYPKVQRCVNSLHKRTHNASLDIVSCRWKVRTQTFTSISVVPPYGIMWSMVVR